MMTRYYYDKVNVQAPQVSVRCFDKMHVYNQAVTQFISYRLDSNDIEKTLYLFKYYSRVHHTKIY